MLCLLQGFAFSSLLKVAAVVTAARGSGFVIQKIVYFRRNPVTHSQEQWETWSPPLYYTVDEAGAGAALGEWRPSSRTLGIWQINNPGSHC